MYTSFVSQLFKITKLLQQYPITYMYMKLLKYVIIDPLFVLFNGCSKLRQVSYYTLKTY